MVSVRLPLEDARENIIDQTFDLFSFLDQGDISSEVPIDMDVPNPIEGASRFLGRVLDIGMQIIAGSVSYVGAQQESGFVLLDDAVTCGNRGTGATTDGPGSGKS